VPNTTFNAFQIQTPAASPFNYNTGSLQPPHPITTSMKCTYEMAHVQYNTIITSIKVQYSPYIFQMEPVGTTSKLVTP
jgi:hypothetical protein